MKEFAPLGADSFLKEQTPFWKGYIIQGSKQEATKDITLCKNDIKYVGAPIHHNKGKGFP